MYIILECLTCGQKIGHLREIYLNLVLEFSKEEDPNGKTPEFRALKVLSEKHGFDTSSYCCRKTVLCDYDSTNIITG